MEVVSYSSFTPMNSFWDTPVVCAEMQVVVENLKIYHSLNENETMQLTQEIFEPLWLVLPMYTQHVYRDARSSYKQSHPHLDGPDVERHED